MCVHYAAFTLSFIHIVYKYTLYVLFICICNISLHQYSYCIVYTIVCIFLLSAYNIGCVIQDIFTELT